LIIGIEKFSSTIPLYSFVRTTGCPHTAWFPPAISLNNLEGLNRCKDKDILKKKEKYTKGKSINFFSSETKF